MAGLTSVNNEDVVAGLLKRQTNDLTDVLKHFEEGNPVKDTAPESLRRVEQQS